MFRLGQRSSCSKPPSAPIAWYCHNAGSRQHPVGGKLANGWGLFDVLGNVEEWTSDVFYGMGYGESPLTDPAGHWWEIAGKQDRDLMPRDGDAPDRQRAMIMRGGSHLFASASLKVNRRNYMPLPETSSSSNGLRLVRTLF